MLRVYNPSWSIHFYQSPRSINRTYIYLHIKNEREGIRKQILRFFIILCTLWRQWQCLLCLSIEHHTSVSISVSVYSSQLDSRTRQDRKRFLCWSQVVSEKNGILSLQLACPALGGDTKEGSERAIVKPVTLPTHLNCRPLSREDQPEDQHKDNQRITQELFDAPMIKIFGIATAQWIFVRFVLLNKTIWNTW